MSLTINTNLSSLIVQSSLTQSTNGLNQAIERMTTGFKINGAKDNAAGYSIANSMGVKLSSYDVAMDNVMLGTTLIDTASSNLSLITDHLQRMRDLSEQAANGTYGEDSLNAIQSEIDARTAEINRIMSNTEYNGIKLFEGEETSGVPGRATESVDESKRVVNQTNFQSGETYYLTTSDDLVKLQDLVNSGVDTTNVTFELMNDIDMQGVSFQGIGNGGADGSDDTKIFKGNFNGNEHIISNLTINTSEDRVGLFGISMGNIDSLGLENCDITGQDYVGGLVAVGGGNISGCYVNGSITGNEFVGGIASIGENLVIDKSFVKGQISGNVGVGGLLGASYFSVIINDSYTEVEVTGDSDIGGLLGTSYIDVTVNNSYVTGSVIGNSNIGAFAGTVGAGTLIECYYDKQTTGQNVGIANNLGTGDAVGVTTAELKALIQNGTLPEYDYEKAFGGGSGTGVGVNNSGREFILQVGIDSDDNSKLTFDTALGFQLNIDVTSHAGALDALTAIDSILETVNNKQTEFGAVQNRLESVTESLSINIENLTSSMSTIKDADIAEESSNYIKYQILQQASATLLATANQTPSIALQLL